MYYSPNRKGRYSARLEDISPVSMWAEDAVPMFVVHDSNCIASAAYLMVACNLRNINYDRRGEYNIGCMKATLS